MPNIKACPFCEEVTDTVVPGHIRTSPPLSRRRIEVSEPAVTEDPAVMWLPARISAPDEPGANGTATG